MYGALDVCIQLQKTAPGTLYVSDIVTRKKIELFSPDTAGFSSSSKKNE